MGKTQKRVRQTQQIPSKKGITGTASKSHTAAADHHLLLDCLRGSGGKVTAVAIDPEGTQIAVCCTDSSVRVTKVDVKNSSQPLPPNLKTIRVLLEGLDIITAVDFSEDGQTLFGALEYRSNLTRLQIAADNKGKPLQPMIKCTEMLHKDVVRSLVSSKGRWIVTSSCSDADTKIRFWSYEGQLLATYDTKQVKNYELAVSPSDGRFFGVPAWTSGVKLVEVIAPHGQYSRIERAMDLKTSCGTQALAISSDNRRALLVCKDGQFLLWNIDVRYQVSEDPKLLVSKRDEDLEFKNVSFLGFSPDDKRVVVVADKHLKILDASSLSTLEVVLCAHGSPIDRIATAQCGNCFVSVAGEERPRFWSF